MNNYSISITVLFLFIICSAPNTKLKDFIIPVFNQNNDSTEILQLEDEWASALVKRDIGLFSRVLAEGFIYTENDIVYVRDSVIKYVAYGTDTVESAHNEEMQVHMFGKTAVVTGWLVVNGHGEGGNFNRKYRFTDTWSYIDDRWQLIAAHDYIAL